MVGSFMAWPVEDNHQQGQGWRKGPWTPEEDKLLIEHVNLHGEGRWSSVARCAGLNRSGKSCRLRWVNYLRPGLKRGQITPQEEGIIIELHAIWGNKWSTIARNLPGRTDNEIKNYWRTHFKKKERSRKTSSQRRKSQNYLKQKPQLIQPKETTTSKLQKQLEPPKVLVPSQEINTNKQLVEELFMYPNTTIYDENLMITASSWMDATCIDQDGPWCGSLWNFGDNNQYCSKMALSIQNQATITNNNIHNINNNYNVFSWEGDLNNIYNNEGYIF